MILKKSKGVSQLPPKNQGKMSKIDINDTILKAWNDGFMQSEIAKFLELSDAGGVRF